MARCEHPCDVDQKVAVAVRAERKFIVDFIKLAAGWLETLRTRENLYAADALRIIVEQLEGDDECS